MGKKHKPRHNPYQRSARDSRSGVHNYYYLDESHRIAVPSGRCLKCGKITNSFCDRCSSWSCGSHLTKKGDEELCEKCLG